MHIKNKITNFELSGVPFPWKRVPGLKHLNLKSVIGTWIFLVMEWIAFVSAVADRVSLFDNLDFLDRDGATRRENNW
jgi:hypothetical protein